MWARHRPDITLRDLGFAARSLLAPTSQVAELNDAIVRDWFPADETIVCLSVRSGFDLLLQSLPLKPGDEVLFSEVTIEGMRRIVEQAGGVARGVPVERSCLAPTPELVGALITDRTRALVVAPLFGSRNPLGPLAEVARRRGVLVVEDAAQAFTGRSFSGSPGADVTMFSFGMIKRSTAAGGAVLRVRDAPLREAMLERLESYPSQSRRAYTQRLAMLALLHIASDRRLYGIVYRLLNALGAPDRRVSGLGKTGRSQQSLDRLRRRPCGPLRRLLARRTQQGLQLPPLVASDAHHALGANACGSKAEIAPGWVLPATFEHPERVVSQLRRLGYDASRLSSLIRIEAEAPLDHNPDDHWLERTVFLPTDRDMPAGERMRMIQAAVACDQQRD